MNDVQNNLITHVKLYFHEKEQIDENELRDAVKLFENIYHLNNQTERDEVIKDLKTQLAIKMDIGHFIKEKNHKTWYFNAKSEIDGKYWDRYSIYLNSHMGLSNKVINIIDKNTDDMMDLLGNPNQSEGFARKGLVIGDVQSGKTSTYTALINKAADSGYKIIILLTGTIEKLRQQTQERLDEGFIGQDSTAYANNKNKIIVGVGEIGNYEVSPWSITTTSSDFNTSVANQLNGKISSISSPVLFVLKKNRSVLDKLEDWLKKYNANASGQIDAPMLLIDDEADNASVNTKKDGDDSPTAINGCIRKILKLFTHNSYVAFTATPYANIFINPETNDEMLNDDLFPRDFIYVIDAPNNYIGANSVFDNEGKFNYMLHTNNDCESFVPEGHKIDFVPSEIPESLKKAIVSFFISNAIRDLRGQTKTHRSMLINISRFINVQGEICKLVDGYVRDCQREYKNYCNLPTEQALKHKKIKLAREVYEDLYLNNVKINSDIKEEMFSWHKVQNNLDKSCSSIVVRTVNGGNSQKNLNYIENKEEGLRIIAIGGISLSRGLTLEGLSTSYFYRNSKMYDTLMQMGRWFGYRPHYADLCTIWMPESSIEWYSYITTAQEELKREVKKMMNENKTPKDYGLCVRSDINSLIVTATNKMRNSKEMPISISLNGTVVETPHLPIKKEINKNNEVAVNNFIKGLLANGYEFTKTKIINGINEDLDQKHNQILNVSKDYIIKFLNDYKTSLFNMTLEPESIVNMIKNDDEEKILQNWDVIIADNNNNKPIELANVLSIGPIKRSCNIDNQGRFIRVSSSKHRLGSVNYAKGGLTKSEVKKIEKLIIDSREDEDKEKGFSENDYFNTGYLRNPLLIIYPVKLELVEDQIEREKYLDDVGGIHYGIGIGIPSIDGKKKIIHKYKVNMVKWKELLNVDDDAYEETGEES